MVKCHIRTFRQDLSVTHDKSQILACQVPSVMRDRQIDWNPTVLGNVGVLHIMYFVFLKATVMILSTKMHPTSVGRGINFMFYIDMTLFSSQHWWGAFLCSKSLLLPFKIQNTWYVTHQQYPVYLLYCTISINSSPWLDFQNIWASDHWSGAKSGVKPYFVTPLWCMTDKLFEIVQYMPCQF